MTRLQQVNITYEKCAKYVEEKQVASQDLQLLAKNNHFETAQKIF